MTLPDPQLFWEDGTPRSQNNAFTGHGYPMPVDMRKESAALRAGANSAATKRAREQELFPRLQLKGSQMRRPEPEVEGA